ncbi:MAG: STAS domain-containing protein [Firmicutes bacterium]|nr:STAS domain-containing protein [Bacillota bacterium]
MTVQKKNRNEAVVFMGQKLTATNSSELKEQIYSLIAEGYRRITLDFSLSNFIDASGLGKICALQKMLRENQGELRIINVNSSYVQRIFNLVQLQKVISIK